MRAMKEREYFRARDAIRRDCEEKLRALDTTWTVMNSSPPPKQPPTTTRRRSPTDNGQSLAAALVEVINGMPTEFNTVDVHDILRKLRPDFSGSRSTVTHTLKRLADGNSPPIEIVESGKGKRATRYRKLPIPEAAAANLDDL